MDPVNVHGPGPWTGSTEGGPWTRGPCFVLSRGKLLHSWSFLLIFHSKDSGADHNSTATRREEGRGGYLSDDKP